MDLDIITVSLNPVNKIIVKKVSLKVSLIAVKCHRLSLSLIAVNETLDDRTRWGVGTGSDS
jgi:hypothetical protein